MPPLSYPAFIERLKREQGSDRAMEAAIGRHFDPVGEILCAFLVQNGLLPTHGSRRTSPRSSRSCSRLR